MTFIDKANTDSIAGPYYETENCWRNGGGCVVESEDRLRVVKLKSQEVPPQAHPYLEIRGCLLKY
jgi:hypothetical protein